MAASEKISQMPQNQASKADSPEENMANPEKLLEETRRDMGKVGLFVSLLAVVLVVVFFYGINQNLTGLEHRVDELAYLEEDVASLNEKMTTMDGKISAVEGDVSYLDNSLTTLGESVQGVKSQVSGMSEEVAAVQEDVTQMDARVAELEDLPEKTRKMLLVNALQEINQKAGYLGQQMSEEEAAKLEQAQKLMQEVQQGLQ
ncbi:hypothetical protein [Desulfohalobium retbaense]|uniref:Uncharacterized protein n=1 Tax=Desulfohalobium retbaense (strain ATCC 49708 / DSM 5692 / JCM 16813 / HR100) TaxID=485915 RepID=C8X3K4_DESRD|nr:hypothetical protein [Desulfohalobium retbaense]ACV69001.1 hypothetical protein Dret_1717 [Desulfohalobium retbaense DSM 5692]